MDNNYKSPFEEGGQNNFNGGQPQNNGWQQPNGGWQQPSQPNFENGQGGFPNGQLQNNGWQQPNQNFGFPNQPVQQTPQPNVPQGFEPIYIEGVIKGYQNQQGQLFDFNGVPLQPWLEMGQSKGYINRNGETFDHNLNPVGSGMPPHVDSGELQEDDVEDIKELSTGTKVGIFIGGTLIILITIVGIIWFVNKRSSTPEETVPSSEVVTTQSVQTSKEVSEETSEPQTKSDESETKTTNQSENNPPIKDGVVEDKVLKNDAVIESIELVSENDLLANYNVRVKMGSSKLDIKFNYSEASQLSVGDKLLISYSKVQSKNFDRVVIRSVAFLND